LNHGFDLNVESALDAGLNLGRHSFEMAQKEFLNSGLEALQRIPTRDIVESKYKSVCEKYNLLGIRGI
jgi:hypothetical protein